MQTCCEKQVHTKTLKEEKKKDETKETQKEELRRTFSPPNSVPLGVLNAFLRCLPWFWMACPPSRGSCLPLSPIVPLLVSLCWMVCPPSRGSCLPGPPIVSLLGYDFGQEQEQALLAVLLYRVSGGFVSKTSPKHVQKNQPKSMTDFF